jgi:hypothetical protein
MRKRKVVKVAVGDWKPLTHVNSRVLSGYGLITHSFGDNYLNYLVWMSPQTFYRRNYANKPILEFKCDKEKS